MLYNSYIFILVFLPAVLAGYFLLNHLKRYPLALAWLCVASLFFYGYFNWSYLPIILVINVLFGTDISLLHLLLPLGISFFTFQQMSYL
jgi:alginate O-acetyltransferase complex protein AlgI